jgi:hypothetical protein
VSRGVKKTQLGASWSKKQRDVMLHFPLGILSSSDGHWLSGIFDADFVRHLRERGYDPNTLRFTVEIDFANKHSQEKFPTLFRGRAKQ